MKRISRRRLIALAAAASSGSRSIASVGKLNQSGEYNQLLANHIDWPQFLARHDLIWDQIPKNWGQAAFLGNGRLALYMYAEPGQNALRFGLDNTDVYDRRDASWGWVAYSRSRYHVGDFLLAPTGQITGIAMRLDLYRAELRGTLNTDRGSIDFRAFVHAEESILAVELTPSDGEKEYRWNWRPTEAISTRRPIRNEADAEAYQKMYGHPVKIWVPNPPGSEEKDGDIHLYTQKLLVGGGYTTAWQEATQPSGSRVLFISSVMSYPQLTSPQTAKAHVRQAASAGLSELTASHRHWWSAYYPASFLSISDTRLESFYWIQMYKYACAARSRTGIIDTHGPWLQPSSWPYITWNLNTQISYWALQPSNRLLLAEGLFHSLDTHAVQLQANARPECDQPDIAAVGHCSQQDLIAPLDDDRRYEKEWGNLLWVCHNYWLQYRFSMDDALLAHRLFPLLRRAVNFYLHALEEGADGKLHLPETYSPETGTTRDCNYDLALLRWACATLVDSCRRLPLHDPLLPRWRDICHRLTPYPADENGFRIGADRPAIAHRHFSHLLMIYPLYLVNWDDLAARPMIEKSVNYWLSSAMSGKAAAGFTFAVGSSMCSAMGRGNEALHYLSGLISAKSTIGKIFPNTMYAESGQNIETPLAAAQSIHDMLLQSWGGTIRIFPAVPDAWPDAVIHDLRTDGAFLISAVRKGGVTQWVRVRSLAGEPCRIKCDFGADVQVRTVGATVKLTRLGTNVYALDLRKDQEVVLASASTGPRSFEIAPLPADPALCNSYGVRS